MVDQRGCSSCEGAGCHVQVEEHSPAQLAGWRFAFVSVLVFLSPIITAIIGALLWNDNPVHEFMGATTGLIVGLLSSILVQRMIQRVKKEVTRL